MCCVCFFFSSRRQHTRCALVTRVQTCALPISSDMLPFIHPLSAAVDPVWESRSDWEIYKGIAKAFSAIAETELPAAQDLVLTPLQHEIGRASCRESVCQYV